MYAVMRQSVWCIAYRVNGRYGINGKTHCQSISAKTTTTLVKQIKRDKITFEAIQRYLQNQKRLIHSN